MPMNFEDILSRHCTSVVKKQSSKEFLKETPTLYYN